jgi:hypothetical protein
MVSVLSPSFGEAFWILTIAHFPFCVVIVNSVVIPRKAWATIEARGTMQTGARNGEPGVFFVINCNH